MPNDSFWQRPPRVRAYRTGALTVATGTYTSVPWQGQQTDTEGMYSAGSANLTCKVAGWYDIKAQAGWIANATGYRFIAILYNGATAIGTHREVVPGANAFAHQVVSEAYLNVGDTIALQVFQSSGGNLDTGTGGAWDTWIHLRFTGVAA